MYDGEDNRAITIIVTVTGVDVLVIEKYHLIVIVLTHVHNMHKAQKKQA